MHKVGYSVRRVGHVRCPSPTEEGQGCAGLQHAEGVG